MVSNRKETVSVGRQIHANYLGLLVNHVIDEAGILMAESVVVLSPYM
jgi:ABC-type taurine transport system ATPase subunit